MFSRKNRNNIQPSKDSYIPEKGLSEESFDLNTSIGNQAMIENLDLISE